MERVIFMLIFAILNKLARGRPTANQTSLILNPIYVTDETNHTSVPGTLFTTVFDAHRALKEMSHKSHGNNSKEHGETSKQIAKVLFPNIPTSISNATGKEEYFIKIPVLPQPFSDYKIIVATAPWRMKIRRGDAKPVVVYFVIPEDNEDIDTSNMNIPEIYFVKRGGVIDDIIKKETKRDPLIIVDNNRTVTGLKSNTVSKFIKFKNKLIKNEGFSDSEH